MITISLQCRVDTIRWGYHCIHEVILLFAHHCCCVKYSCRNNELQPFSIYPNIKLLFISSHRKVKFVSFIQIHSLGSYSNGSVLLQSTLTCDHGENMETCPSDPVTLQSWQSPIISQYLLCTSIFIFLDRAGNKVFIPQSWSDTRKMGFLDIQLQNWVQPSMLPSYTKRGFEKRSVPDQLYHYLLESVKRGRTVREPCIPSGHINCNEEGEDNAAEVEIIAVADRGEMKTVVNESLISVASDWADTALEFSDYWGPRVYHRGARLSLHVDKLSTHIISAIINIDQDMEQDWVLDILDHHGDSHKIGLQPGEMLLYESAKLPHGRVKPLVGDSYTNIFVHFKPLDHAFYDNSVWKYMSPS